MKTFISILAMVLTVTFARAQGYVAGPTAQNALVNASGTQLYPVFNGSATNVSPAHARVCRVGVNGFGISGTFGVTNAVTNGTTLVFELIADVNGTNAMSAGNAQLPTLSFVVPAVGTSPFFYWTNIPPTSQNIGNLPGIRLKSVTPTNAAALYITNLHIWAR
jgi:hypothetical protein